MRQPAENVEAASSYRHRRLIYRLLFITGLDIVYLHIEVVGGLLRADDDIRIHLLDRLLPGKAGPRQQLDGELEVAASNTIKIIQLLGVCRITINNSVNFSSEV